MRQTTLCALPAFLFTLAALVTPLLAAEAENEVLDPMVEEYAEPDEAVENGQADIDHPLEPVDNQGGRRFRYGTVLEYWFLKPGEPFERALSEPSLTGMVDDSKQYFLGSAMLKDPELKTYADRQGVLQWTAYLRASKPGKYVFALTSGLGANPPSEGYAGAALLVNGEEKIVIHGNGIESAAADFSKPGLYKLQIRLWWSGKEKPVFEDYTAQLKIREPGTLSLRQLNRKEILYTLP